MGGERRGGRGEGDSCEEEKKGVEDEKEEEEEEKEKEEEEEPSGNSGATSPLGPDDRQQARRVQLFILHQKNCHHHRPNLKISSLSKVSKLKSIPLQSRGLLDKRKTDVKIKK